MFLFPPSPAGQAPRSERPRRGRLVRGSRGPRSLGLALGIFLLGTTLAVVGALEWHSSVEAQHRQSFQTTATDVSETVETLLRRDADFVGSVRAVLTMEPGLSQTEFGRWYQQLDGRHRQVGSLGTTVVGSVPVSAIASFLRTRNADPVFRGMVGGRIVPLTQHGRDRACLVATSESLGGLSPEVASVLQGDWCLPTSMIGRTQAPLQRAAMDSGQILAFPVAAQGVNTTFFEAAFYRPGASLQTVARRRAALVGWVVSSFDLDTVIRTATGGHRGLGVALYHSNPGHSPELVGQAGRGATGPYRSATRFQIQGSWTVRIVGEVPAGALSPNLQALMILLGGVLVSLLLSVLVLVLGRSRERALGLVEEKTGELRHQALHDSLTGLPNRVLALDRAEQMLARARRQPASVAALYVDIDGFKQVNDSFGHAAGDELLRIVASRLSGVVRGADTAARLGGDEFIVLVEGSTLDAGPELVAERLLDVLREPYELNGEIGRELSVTASIGIACGPRESADELLRDADIALYEAKAAGRNRFVLFQSDMQTAMQDRLTMGLDLAEALERDQLFLLYQPTFDLETEKVDRGGGAAALATPHPRPDPARASSSRSRRTPA